MKLHLPVRLFKSVLACLAAVASFSLGSGVAWAEAQKLMFNGTTLTWDTSEDNKSFEDAEDNAAAFAAGDNVSFSGESTVTLGENISAGTVAIEKDADVTIDLGEFELDAARIELSGSLDMGDSLSIGKGENLAITGAGAVLGSNLVLGEKGVLSVTGACGSLNGHSLTLQDGASLILTGAVLSRETIDADGDGKLSLIVTPTGDGKTYTLLTGVGNLLDAEGNPLSLTDENNDVSLYFDTTQPGTGFWAGGWLQFVDGKLQLVLHGEEVQESLIFSTRQTGSKTYNYYEGITFRDITYTASGASSYGGAIDGGGEAGGLIITDNALGVNEDGSAQQLLFENNYAEGSTAYGGAIYAGRGYSLKINNIGETIFRGNYAYATAFGATGGAIQRQPGIFSIQNNASVVFERNYTLQDETLRLQSIYAFEGLDSAGEELLVYFSAPEGGKIEFRDSIDIDVDSNFWSRGAHREEYHLGLGPGEEPCSRDTGWCSSLS